MSNSERQSERREQQENNEDGRESRENAREVNDEQNENNTTVSPGSAGEAEENNAVPLTQYNENQNAEQQKLQENLTQRPNEIKGSRESRVNKRKSELYVLHGERGSVFVNRKCHLPRTEGVDVKARRTLIIASILCLVFTIIEIIGGLLSNSLAVGADAAHTLSDFAGFMISLFAIWLAGRQATDRFSFGWHRAEIIGALTSIMVIWAVTAVLVWLAIQRCITGDFEVDAIIMMITSVFAIITNILLSWVLIRGSTNVEIECNSQNATGTTQQFHAHGHSHGDGLKKISNFFQKCAKKKRNTIDSEITNNDGSLKNPCIQQRNINIQTAILHVLGDGLQSVGVFIAGLVIYLQPTWVIADPICTFLFAFIVLYTTISMLKSVVLVLMEGTPSYMDYREIKMIFEGIDGVQSVHRLRVWALTMDKIALAVHLVIERGRNANEILATAEKLIHTHYKLFETTIQIEEE